MNSKFLATALFALLITLSCLSGNARADLINIEVNGGADLIDPALAPFFNTGDEMTLRFNMDLDVIGFENAWFSSSNQMTPMEFSIGSHNGSVASYRPGITNGPSCPFTCGDVWTAEAKNDFGTSFNFPMFGDYYLDIIQIEYWDDTGAALNTANMAASIAQLDSFTDWHLALYFKDINNPDNVRVSIRSNTPNVGISQVPEPSPLAILILGLLGLMSMARKN